MAPVNNSNNQPTLPIPIEGHHGRRRSNSSSDDSDSSNSPTTPLSSATPFPTPAAGLPPRVAPISPSASPILSYFLNQPSPKSPTNTFPFRRNFGPPVIEDDEPESAPASNKHARRASNAWSGSERFTQPPTVPAPGGQQERAVGIMRRLSLGGALARPQIPNFKPTGGQDDRPQAQRSATPPGRSTPSADTPRKARRANTLAPGTARPPHRAPSPMGERILKGHFDGFN
ncbi:uncharacterized protein FIBRA_01312 [Fibroporia radiculosa]|uniref:Uncharacterized protein n=1 Tax=Fibroporia radiculosa TaxID=599839 RepID=J4I8F0_9APHY|nr:uncharacterized protein FIBRA_01312 [Fibroporia radiculosa]CCL99296.1 predicted protein [Fibroporia radiculosa]